MLPFPWGTASGDGAPLSGRNKFSEMPTRPIGRAVELTEGVKFNRFAQLFN
jgi:hypothetical protein